MTSGSTDGEPPRRRRLWQAVTGLSILIAAFAVFAWQQGGDGDSDGPLNAIAEAAERTQREPGGRSTIRAIVSSPVRSESFTITGWAVFNSEDRSRAVLTFPSSESDGSEKMEVVGDGTVVYMRSSQFGSLPDGREWMALDFSSFGMEPASPVPANVDAKGELALLEAATGDVQRLGREDVRGVRTTRYRGTVGVAEHAEQLRDEGEDEIASYIEEEASPMQVEAWIGADGLVRRMRIVQSKPGEAGKGPVTTDMRATFFGFGIDPEIDVPESSEVFDATGLAEDELGL